MKSMYTKIILFILIVGVLSACGVQPANSPTSQPTEEALPATEAPPDPPPAADTAAPTEPAAATQPAVEGATVSFTNDILPIFESRCVNCHGGEKTQEGLDLKTHAALMAGSDNGSVVTAGDATNSLLVELVVSQKMPKRGPKLTPPQVQLLTDWVNQGALDN
ncbi:MAG TPA: c-type cytochrome domain-containing protein [Anaerolineales bacterium]|nr:c-type cytochrome domain-containing protein [Anaerolineales bacterium]